MLSTTLHQYSPGFAHLPSPTLQNHDQHISPQHMSPVGLDSFAHSSDYALQQLQQGRQALSFDKLRHHPYANGPMTALPRSHRDTMPPERSGRNSGTAPIRRRISRACDQCNQLRTKCDGKAPCAHCIEFGLTCEYIRERKKRGKASRKDIAAQQAAVAAATISEKAQASPQTGDVSTPDGRSVTGASFDTPRSNSEQSSTQPSNHGISNSVSGNGVYSGITSMPQGANLGTPSDVTANGHQEMSGSDERFTPTLPSSHLPNNGISDRSGSFMGMTDFSGMDDYQRGLMQSAHASHPVLQNGSNMLPHPLMTQNGIQNFNDGAYPLLSPQSQQGTANPFRMPTGESPLNGFLGSSPVAGSPGWLSIPSPTAGLYQQQAMNSAQSLRYPVLRPLLPHLGNIIPVSLACDLLELYFQSSSSEYMRPLSPYVLGFVFRKRSFLRQNSPRLCSPALLASMLWIGAQTSESAYLTSPPSARGKICQKLLELTVGLLKPLIHAPASNEGSPTQWLNTVINGVALGGFGVALPGSAQEPENSTPGATGALDDIATYMHLAVVVSASEYKAASLRWWNAAWSMARELKLGRELPPNPEQPFKEGPEDQDVDADGEVDVDMDLSNGTHATDGRQNGVNMAAHQPGYVSEEEREERRRLWWLLYTVDRHLALCYNRPLFLLDIECEGLLQPIDEGLWQAGDFFHDEAAKASTDPTSPSYRRRGPSFQCTSHSIFGYFTPLMTILGEIVDLNHARNHPRYGLPYRSGTYWDEQAAEIAQRLEAYGRSLRELESRYSAIAEAAQQEANGGESNQQEANTPSSRSVNSSTSRITETIIQTKIVVAYGTHLMHTLHILLNGKWDPISLLDDNDLWISTQSFITATGHAVSAAEAIDDILEHDPDLTFMPFFFGIYLLQGSFLLLLIADKLQGEASPSVVKACETIVRAHEACVVTLNTEYQRNFRKVMRSALNQVHGRCLEDFGEQQLRRREVLALYRWTGDGTGLAL